MEELIWPAVAVMVLVGVVGVLVAVRQARRARRSGRRRVRLLLAGMVGALVGLLWAGVLMLLAVSVFWMAHVIRVFL
ncbi:hypothetical protein LG293_17955 (plasmid) [Citricoccus nitrophenolicus]